ncbi:hypothetical protein VIGAN_06089400, partial [Vigna angularis var. angularis]
QGAKRKHCHKNTQSPFWFTLEPEFKPEVLAAMVHCTTKRGPTDSTTPWRLLILAPDCRTQFGASGSESTALDPWLVPEKRQLIISNRPWATSQPWRLKGMKFQAVTRISLFRAAGRKRRRSQQRVAEASEKRRQEQGGERAGRVRVPTRTVERGRGVRTQQVVERCGGGVEEKTEWAVAVTVTGRGD